MQQIDLSSLVITLKKKIITPEYRDDRLKIIYHEKKNRYLVSCFF